MPTGVYIRVKQRNGWKLSDENKENIRNGHLGLKYSPMSEEGKINISKALTGRILSEEHKKNLNKFPIGENHPNWVGGSSIIYGKEFTESLKEQIRQRDNYQCQECGYFQKDLGYKLPVHHIDYDKENNDPLNLISLCKSCHMKASFHRDNWTEYYNNKIREGGAVK